MAGVRAKAGKMDGVGETRGVIIFQGGQGRLLARVKFEPKPEGSEGLRHAVVGKITSGRGHGRAQRPWGRSVLGPFGELQVKTSL